MDKNKVQRMRNLVSGNYGSKTKKQMGYKKYNNKKYEGDIWEEGGRTWTIKNGIKQNIRKLNKAKDYLRIPLKCPKCETAMNKSQHKFMYMKHGHCLFCQTEDIHNMIREGTYDKWLIENVKKNFISWKKNKQEAFNNYLQNINSKHYITEAGLVEDWSEMSNDTKEYMLEKFNEFIKSEEENLQKLIEEQENIK
jgi:hypothetical protein